MDPNIKSFQAPPLEYFTGDQMRTIHSASLEILEDLGVDVHHDEALALLKKAGAFIGQGRRVHIPTALAEWAVRQAPSRVVIYNRRGQATMFLENRNVYFGTGSDCPNLLDGETGQIRDFLSADVADAVRLVDALPNLDFTMSNGLASDFDPKAQYRNVYALMVRNTVKPQVVIAGDRKALKDIIDIAAAVVGGSETLRRKPLFVLYDEPTSPLVHSFEALDKLLFMAEAGLPTNYSPGIMAGGTGPVTMAGAVTLANAEILSGLVIHQLKNPGAPFIFGAGMSPLDMSSGQPTYSAPEAMMTQAGLCQIGRALYQLPTWGFAGCSASKLADEQAAAEAFTYIMAAGWMGSNLVHDVGYLEFGLTYSYELLVMCDEVIGQLRRMMEGITVDREHLAVEAIKRVGVGGHFVSDEHTFEHFRRNWRPVLTDRNSRPTWLDKGGSSMGRRARSRVARLLETHRPEPLPDKVEAEINEILDR